MKFTANKDNWNILKNDLELNKEVYWWDWSTIIHESKQYLIIKRGTIFSGKYHIFPKIENLLLSNYNLDNAQRYRDVNSIDIGGNTLGKQTDLIYGKTIILSHGISFGNIPVIKKPDQWIENKILKELI